MPKLERYKACLQKMGYHIEGDLVLSETIWGTWVQKIVYVGDPNFGEFGLETVKSPLDNID